MEPKDIKNLQIGKTLQRVAVGESLTVTTADGSVVIAKAATPIKNADVAFQKIADGTWVAFDFKRDQMTSRNEKIDIRRTKPTIREIVTSPQYKVKGLVKFTDNKIYKGGDGVIVYLDQTVDELDELLSFNSTGSGSLDYVAVWRNGNNLVLDKAGQRTVFSDYFIKILTAASYRRTYDDLRRGVNFFGKFYSPGVGWSGGGGPIDYDDIAGSLDYGINATVNTTVDYITYYYYWTWTYPYSFTIPPSDFFGSISLPTFDGSGSGHLDMTKRDGENLAVNGSQSNDIHRTFPVGYTNFGDVVQTTGIFDYVLNINLPNKDSGTLSKEETTNWSLDVVVPGISPLHNSYSLQVNKTGSCGGGVRTSIETQTMECHYKLPVWVGDEFVIVEQHDTEVEQVATSNAVNGESITAFAELAAYEGHFRDFPKRAVFSGRGWTIVSSNIHTTRNTRFSESRIEYFWQLSGDSIFTCINTSTSDAITINTDSLIFDIEYGNDILAGKNVGDAISFTYEDWLIRSGITDISVADIIEEEGYHAIPYTAGNHGKYLTSDFATEYTYDVLSDTTTIVSSDNTAFNAFWNSMQGKMFDIYYKEGETCYILEAALVFEYIDSDTLYEAMPGEIAHGATNRFLTAITGTIVSKRECKGGMAKEMMESIFFEEYYETIAISQDNYWNYIQTTQSAWWNPVIREDSMWYSFSKMNGFLRDGGVILTFTQPPSKEKITQEHTVYTEVFALLSDGRFIRLGEEASPASAMALGTPVPFYPEFWSYYSQ